MRLDLFLKTARLVKRRTIARELCENGRVLVNGHDAKPSRDVKQADVITLKFQSRSIEVEIIDLPTGTNRKTAAQELFRVKSEIRLPDNRDIWSENPSSS